MSRYFTTYLALVCLAVSVAYADEPKVMHEGVGANNNTAIATAPVRGRVGEESAGATTDVSEVSVTDTKLLLEMIEQVNNLGKKKSGTGEVVSTELE